MKEYNCMHKPDTQLTPTYYLNTILKLFYTVRRISVASNAIQTIENEA
jgi:hypothetical protein